MAYMLMREQLDMKSRGVDIAAKEKADEALQWKEFSQFASQVCGCVCVCAIS